MKKSNKTLSVQLTIPLSNETERFEEWLEKAQEVCQNRSDDYYADLLYQLLTKNHAKASQEFKVLYSDLVSKFRTFIEGMYILGIQTKIECKVPFVLPYINELEYAETTSNPAESPYAIGDTEVRSSS